MKNNFLNIVFLSSTIFVVVMGVFLFWTPSFAQGPALPPAQVCGDGIMTGTEQCDIGILNGTCPSLCSTSCTVNLCNNPPSQEPPTIEIVPIYCNSNNNKCVYSEQIGQCTKNADCAYQGSNPSPSYSTCISNICSYEWHSNESCTDVSNCTAGVSPGEDYTLPTDMPPSSPPTNYLPPPTDSDPWWYWISYNWWYYTNPSSPLYSPPGSTPTPTQTPSSTPPSGDFHNECDPVSFMCVRREGAGDNACGKSNDCGHNICSSELTCQRVAGPGLNECPAPGVNSYCYGGVYIQKFTSSDQSGNAQDATFPFTSNISDNPNFNITTSGGSGSYLINKVKPGKYSVTENPPAGWKLTSNSCASVTVTPNNIATCYLQNQKEESYIEVIKFTEGGDGEFEFYLTATGNRFKIQTSGGSGSAEKIKVDPTKRHSIEEIISDKTWTLWDVNCDNEYDYSYSGELLNGATNIKVNPGTTTTCIFENTRSSLVIKKIAYSGGEVEDATFNFYITPSGGPKSITTEGGEGETDFINLDSNQKYSIKELAPTGGWTLDNAYCDKGSDYFYENQKFIGVTNVVILPGETTTCTFENSKTNLVITKRTKDIQGNSLGEDATFEYYIYPGVKRIQVTTQNGEGKSDEISLDPNQEYIISEYYPKGKGWELRSVYCDQSYQEYTEGLGDNEKLVGVKNLNLSPGGTTNCIFGNAQTQTGGGGGSVPGRQRLPEKPTGQP